MKKTLVLDIYDSKEVLPERSDDYLVLVERSMEWVTMSYSTKHKAFNTLDGQTRIEALKTKLTAIYWAELPKEITAE